MTGRGLNGCKDEVVRRIEWEEENVRRGVRVCDFSSLY